MQFLDKYFHRVGQVTSFNKTRTFVVIACATYLIILNSFCSEKKPNKIQIFLKNVDLVHLNKYAIL